MSLTPPRSYELPFFREQQGLSLGEDVPHTAAKHSSFQTRQFSLGGNETECSPIGTLHDLLK